jgi:hypothetical protein
VAKKVISPEAALEKASDKEAFARAVERLQISEGGT